MQPNAGALSRVGEEASVRKTARCWKQRVARDTCVPGALASSLTGQWVQQCRASTECVHRELELLPGATRNAFGRWRGLDGVSDTSDGVSCSCGGDAPSSDGGVPLFVVKHATSIATGVAAKIGYGAGHGARIGSWPASRRAGDPAGMGSRARDPEAIKTRESMADVRLSCETVRQPVGKGPPTRSHYQDLLSTH